MTKSKKLQRKSDSRHHEVGLHKLSSRGRKVSCAGCHKKRRVKASEKKELEDAVCSVCMEFPHNAVLLLCSSYDKGCRAYMCATSHRYSNCLEQYRKAYTKVTSNGSTEPPQRHTDDTEYSEESGLHDEKKEIPELLCPLCRGQVKGWTVVEPVRRYLNAKRRICMQDKCSFVGTYKELRKHVKLEHPLSRPRDVDPSHVEKWRKLENERDLSDVFSTIRSTVPGAIVIGDYVIERGNYRGIYDNVLFRFPTFDGRWNGPPRFGDEVAPSHMGDDDFLYARSRARLFAGRRLERLRMGR